MDSFITLYKIQTQAMAMVESIWPNFKKLGKAKMTSQATEQRLSRLRAQFAQIEQLNRDLIVASSDDIFSNHPYFTDNQFQRCAESCDGMIDLLQEHARSIAPETTSIASNEQCTVIHDTVRLPRLEIPKFGGSHTQWEAFRDQFTSLVIDQPGLRGSTKLHYLRAALSPDELQIINHLPLTDANFKIAWDRIRERFDLPRLIIEAHLQVLDSLPSSIPDTAVALRQIHDTVTSTVQALSNLNYNLDRLSSIMLVHSITKRFHKTTYMGWAQHTVHLTEPPSFTELSAFLRARISILGNNPHVPHPSKHSSINALSTTVSSAKCAQCNQDHSIRKCTSFLDLSAADRLTTAQHHNLCLNCLGKHANASCLSRGTCRICKQHHHTLLHEALSAAEQVTSHSAMAHAPQPPRHPQVTLLATATVRVFNANSRSVCVRALLDQGSEATFISEALSQLLNLKKRKADTIISGIGPSAIMSRFQVDLSIGTKGTHTPTLSTTAIVLPKLTSYAARHRTHIELHPQLEHLKFADEDPFGQRSIDLILGADMYGRVLLDGVIRGGEDYPGAQNTVFGWVLSGRCGSHNPPVSVQAHHVTLDALSRTMARFWEVEGVPTRAHMSTEDCATEEHFLATHSRALDGRYIVRLPFQGDPHQSLGESRFIALHSLQRIERRLHADPDKHKAYSDFMAEYENLSHMTEVPAPGPAHQPRPCYIPHHAVSRPTHSSLETPRLRVVFNASARTATGVSLNSLLSSGPKLQLELPTVLLRWRLHRFVIAADVVKMYRQILVHPADQHYQRILWRSTPDQPVRDFQLNTVTYGTTCAPFLALRVLQQLARDDGDQFPRAQSVLTTSTYVDDCLFGADSMTDAISIRNQLISLLRRGGFELSKWIANHTNLLSFDSIESQAAPHKDFTPMDDHKILGIAWHAQSDRFTFQLRDTISDCLSKRSILSAISRVFDPLGWITPVTIRAKIFMQHLWTSALQWDDPLPPDLAGQWRDYHTQLQQLELLSITRWTRYTPSAVVELHGFCDASAHAYAAVVYMRTLNTSDSPEVTLLAAKSRVAPLNTISIPRLELSAAVLLSTLLRFVQDALQLHTSAVYCWTDSTVTLEWLSGSPHRWKTFVANRVTKVHEDAPTAQWRHVPTADNPADCASRGISPPDLRHHPLWWSGPGWLCSSSSEWPASSHHLTPGGTALEERVRVQCMVSQVTKPWDLAQRFSSWTKLLRVTALLFHFRNQLRKRILSRVHHPPHANPSPMMPCTDRSSQHAYRYWIRAIQLESFPEELVALKLDHPVKSSSPLRSLMPYVDDDGLLRVRGRLQHSTISPRAKHPILLRNHPLVCCLIRDTHLQLLHAGPQLVLTHLRTRYWLLRGRQLVRRLIYDCVTCTRQRAPITHPIMGDLPAYRVRPVDRPFTHTGVDYAGPLQVRTSKGRGHRSTKAYVALFVCMTVKAIHLELVSDCSTGAFLAAYHRFVARRGPPRCMYSDNATTFQGADREITTAFRAATTDHTMARQLTDQEVEWHFIPPSAPHFGGLWEAAVKSMKYHLRRCMKGYTFTYEELTTILSRIEACLNSRPLTAASDNLDDYSVITPGHFLIGAPLVSPAEPVESSTSSNMRDRWLVTRQVVQHLWQRWQHEYLHSLQQRTKWRNTSHQIHEGMLVIIRESGLPPTKWLMGRIIQCHPGPDGVVRVVSIKTHTSTLRRPVAKLCFLPVPTSSASDPDAVMAGGDTSYPASPPAHGGRSGPHALDEDH